MEYMVDGGAYLWGFLELSVRVFRRGGGYPLDGGGVSQHVWLESQGRECLWKKR